MKDESWNTQILQYENLGFDLKSPCADCPFRKDFKMDDGAVAALPGYFEHIKSGTFAHTCHKTDPKSPFFKESAYSGKVQHCVGSLIFLEKNKTEIQYALVKAVHDGKLDLKKLQNKDKVCNRKQIIAKAIAYLKSRLGAKPAGLPTHVCRIEG